MDEQKAHAERPPRRLGRLRVVWSVFFGVLTVALVVLWVRSYWGRIGWEALTTATHRYEIYSVEGVCIAIMYPRVFLGFELRIDHPQELFLDLTTGTKLGIGHYSDGYFSGVSIAYWLLTPIVILVAALPWLPFRFSLRTLLIVTTLIAGTLELITWAVSR
jgi:uncharacterized membrane protein